MADGNVLALSYVGDTLRWAKANANAQKSQELETAFALDARRRAMEDSNLQKYLLLDGLMQQRKAVADKLSDLNATAPGTFAAAGLTIPDDMKTVLANLKNPESGTAAVNTLMTAMLAKRDNDYRSRVLSSEESKKPLEAWKFIFDNYEKAGGSAVDALYGTGGNADALNAEIAKNVGNPGEVTPLVGIANVLRYGKKLPMNYEYTPPPWGALRMFPELQNEPSTGDATIRAANVNALLDYEAGNEKLLADPNSTELQALMQPSYLDDKGKPRAIPAADVMAARQRLSNLNRNIQPRLATLRSAGSDAETAAYVQALRSAGGKWNQLPGGMWGINKAGKKFATVSTDRAIEIYKAAYPYGGVPDALRKASRGQPAVPPMTPGATNYTMPADIKAAGETQVDYQGARSGGMTDDQIRGFLKIPVK